MGILADWRVPSLCKLTYIFKKFLVFSAQCTLNESVCAVCLVAQSCLTF